MITYHSFSAFPISIPYLLLSPHLQSHQPKLNSQPCQTLCCFNSLSLIHSAPSGIRLLMLSLHISLPASRLATPAILHGSCGNVFLMFVKLYASAPKMNIMPSRICSVIFAGLLCFRRPLPESMNVPVKV